jgi:hypothetical protein
MPEIIERRDPTKKNPGQDHFHEASVRGSRFSVEVF